MKKRQNKKRPGPEMACGPDGKEDAAIHEPILDNPEADRAFRATVIRQAVAEGMSLADANLLFGNTEAKGES